MSDDASTGADVGMRHAPRPDRHDPRSMALAGLAHTQLHGGFGGVVSFAIEGEHRDRVRFIQDLRLVTSAVSLGHDETLIAYESYPPERARVFAEPFRRHGLIRLAIGLEDPHDIIGDLDAALTTAYGRGDS